MKQIITKDKKVICTTTEPYPKEVIKSMKEADYKIKTVDEDNNEENNK